MAVVHHSPESESKLRSVEEEEEDAKNPWRCRDA